MPYCARKHQLQNSLVYHVYNRSNARVAIFNSGDDYLYFIKLLIEYAARFKVNIYHWVIMPNHYHLLLELEESAKLSKFMAGLNRAYTCYHHRVYFTAGFLWQGRFKLKPIEKEQYLLACGRYIERNPVRAGMVCEAKDYSYSSAKFYCLGQADNLTKEDPCFKEFGQDIVQQRKSYAEFLLNFDTEQENYFADLNKPLGSKEFISKLVKENGRYVPKRRGRPRERIVL